MDQNQSSNAVSLRSGVAEMVEPGTLIRIAVTFGPEECRKLPSQLTLPFATRPPKFTPDLPPQPFVPPAGVQAPQDGYTSPGAVYERGLEIYDRNEEYEQQQWTEAHPPESFDVNATVRPGSTELERLFEGVVPYPKYYPGAPPEFGSISAGTYYLSNPFTEVSGPNNVHTVYELSPEAKSEIESYVLIIAKNYRASPPEPATQVIEVNSVDIEVSPTPSKGPLGT